ncbi:MAG: hypothetical protein LBE36_00295 [Flavobacteriaceae bacterium]|jgi:hypothetical protein|nr:hypothetical protein [Flavobacteriaceae bacterium]
MTVVSDQDFITNHNRYFDLAIDEQVVVKRGDYSFSIVCNSEQPTEQKILQPDDDLRNSLSAEEFKECAIEIVKKIHHKFYGKERQICPENA